MDTDCSGRSLASPLTTQRVHCERNVLDHVLFRVMSGNMISRLVNKGGKSDFDAVDSRTINRKHDERDDRASKVLQCTVTPIGSRGGS